MGKEVTSIAGLKRLLRSVLDSRGSDFEYGNSGSLATRQMTTYGTASTHVMLLGPALGQNVTAPMMVYWNPALGVNAVWFMLYTLRQIAVGTTTFTGPFTITGLTLTINPGWYILSDVPGTTIQALSSTFPLLPNAYQFGRVLAGNINVTTDGGAAAYASQTIVGGVVPHASSFGPLGNGQKWFQYPGTLQQQTLSKKDVVGCSAIDQITMIVGPDILELGGVLDCDARQLVPNMLTFPTFDNGPYMGGYLNGYSFADTSSSPGTATFPLLLSVADYDATALPYLYVPAMEGSGSGFDYWYLPWSLNPITPPRIVMRWGNNLFGTGGVPTKPASVTLIHVYVRAPGYPSTGVFAMATKYVASSHEVINTALADPIVYGSTPRVPTEIVDSPQHVVGYMWIGCFLVVTYTVPAANTGYLSMFEFALFDEANVNTVSPARMAIISQTLVGPVVSQLFRCSIQGYYTVEAAPTQDIAPYSIAPQGTNCVGSIWDALGACFGSPQVSILHRVYRGRDWDALVSDALIGVPDEWMKVLRLLASVYIPASRKRLMWHGLTE